MSVEHLWEVDHPYYSSESNFFSRDYHTNYGSWQAFFEAEGDNDLDYNLLFRWDWSPNDYLEDDSTDGLKAYADRFGDRDHAWTLKLFYVLQRKGIYRAVEVSVCKADEPAVRAFLAKYVAHLRLVWEPLLDRDEVTS